LRIYLDTSVYNRPFDDQAQARIALETQALRTILQLVENNVVTLVNSGALQYENSRNTDISRQMWVERCLQLAQYYQPITDRVTARALELEVRGVGAIDAVHAACAEVAGCDYLLACDDRFLRRYEGSLSAINPVNFVLMMTGDA
jgi:predicted nucleic acid-binding protein